MSNEEKGETSNVSAASFALTLLQINNYVTSKGRLTRRIGGNRGVVRPPEDGGGRVEDWSSDEVHDVGDDGTGEKRATLWSHFDFSVKLVDKHQKRFKLYFCGTRPLFGHMITCNANGS